MTEITYKESNYRFTDPVRYFKANDPYYWEVDNLPLKELAENDLWLKDQLSIAQNLDSIEIDRRGFSELKPYTLGINSTIKVKPGRFIARVNHAYKLTNLQILNLVTGLNLGEITSWNARTAADSTLNTILQKFKSTLAADSLSINGLVGKSYSYASKDKKVTSFYAPSGSPEYGNGLVTPYPIEEFKPWVYDSRYPTYSIVQKDTTSTIGFAVLPQVEMEFVKKWRAAIRTAVVDVPNEIEIDIPPFDPEDHFYVDENGNRVLLNATQRIDLVFVYAKPIDSPSATIAKYINDVPTTITTPQLGIVLGAGLGVDFTDLATISPITRNESGVTSDGIPKMLSHVADENNTLLGFTASGIHGSFPAPDDLMNLTPQLLETLENDHYLLVGQSVLPLAYVVVRKNGTINLAGQPVIAESDLIDIRPFFRTTELSYNERAGIAAALPAASFANPVATEAYVDSELRRVIEDYNSKIGNIPTGGGGGSTSNPTPRVIAGGYVKGGGYFGVEGAIMNMIKYKYNSSLSYERLLTELTTRYGFPTPYTIPALPDWDLAEWCVQGNFSEKGFYPNDYINFHTFGKNNNSQYMTAAGDPRYQYASYGDKNLTTLMPHPGQPINRLYHDIYFVKKTIKLNRAQLEWVKDYHVDVQLWNCVPMSFRKGLVSVNSANHAGISNVWVDKKYDEFTIFVAWTVYIDPNNTRIPPNFRDAPDFTGFMVINNELVNSPWVHALHSGESSAAIATYPTVTFKITGFPFAYSGLSLDLHAPNPVLTLA